MTRIASCWPLVLVGLSLAAVRPALAEDKAKALREALSKEIKYGGQDLPTTTLREELDRLANRNSVTFVINDKAFARAQVGDVARTAISERQPIQPMTTPMKRVLRQILDRLPVDADYVVRGEVIEITTREAVLAEFYADRADSTTPPLVTGTFKDTAFSAVLDELMEQADASVVLDNKVAKTLKEVAVTATLVNVPFDTALRLVAEAAGLKAVRQGNAWYVTDVNGAGSFEKKK